MLAQTLRSLRPRTIHPINQTSKEEQQTTTNETSQTGNTENKNKIENRCLIGWNGKNHNKKQIMHKPLNTESTAASALTGMILGRSVECSIEMWGWPKRVLWSSQAGQMMDIGRSNTSLCRFVPADLV